MCDSSFGCPRIADVVDGEAAVAPARVAAIAGDDHVMQREALALRRGVRFAAGAVHAGQPPARDDLGLHRVLHVDDDEDRVGEAVEMRRDIGIASAGPPQPVDADARHLEERDLARLRGTRDVVDRKPGAERLAIGQRIRERVLEIAAPAVVALHTDDIGAVAEQHQVVGDLQMMRARVRRGDERMHRLGLPSGWTRRSR